MMEYESRGKIMVLGVGVGVGVGRRECLFL